LRLRLTVASLCFISSVRLPGQVWRIWEMVMPLREGRIVVNSSYDGPGCGAPSGWPPVGILRSLEVVEHRCRSSGQSELMGVQDQ
jgi:hypothetical protein